LSTYDRGWRPLALRACGGDHSINYVTTVDDALLFINWRQRTLALSPARFIAAVDFLRTARCRLLWCDDYADGDRWLQRDESGFHQLWLHGVGFYLAAPDLQKFMELCERAAEAKMTAPATVLTGDN